MQTRKIKTGIKLLIFFYAFIVFQHFSVRQNIIRMNTAFEAVFIGTLIYLIYGFFRREQASRWTAIVFHSVFQVLESFALTLYLKPVFLNALVKEFPGLSLATARGMLIVVFAFITCINVSAVVYLWKNSGYFSGDKGREIEETV